VGSNGLKTLLFVFALGWVFSPVGEKALPYWGKKLAGLQSQLNESASRLPRGLSSPDAGLVARAGARIAAAQSKYKQAPEYEGMGGIFLTCSLMVVGAQFQIALIEKRNKNQTLQNRFRGVLESLNQTHEAILELERGRATKLKKDLEAQKKEAEALRKKANQQFSQLESALIQVKKNARGTIISMSDILFDVGKAALKGELKTNLAKIAGILTVFKDSKVIVEGHTDNQGTAEYNQKLSEARAQNVKNFLAEQGVDSTRLSSTGYGLDRPQADNSTKEGRKKNRRVDLVIQDQNRGQ